MEKMFNQYHVFITFGILAVTLVSGVQILEKSAGELTFLKDAILNLTCQHPTSSDQKDQLIFTVNGEKNISKFLPERSYTGGMNKLFIHKKVDKADTGTYLCQFGSVGPEDSVMVQVFEDTKANAQHNFGKYSTDLKDGDTMELICPVLDKLMPTVTWKRDHGNLDRAVLSDTGKTVINGKLTLKDVTVDDRGHYTCTATWYSGEATFTHQVRVKSRLAPLWPAIGIIAEIIVLVVIILACKDRKKKDTEPLTGPSTSESNEKSGSRRKYATSST